MTPLSKEASKDPSRIGDIAAQQPLSGMAVVNSIVKGFNGSTVIKSEKVKKSA